MVLESSRLYKIIGWVAWFTDQTKVTRYTSLELPFKDLPQDGMLAVTYFIKDKKADGFHKRIPWKGYDWYFMAKGIQDDLYGCDVDCRERNVREDIQTRYPKAVIIRGAFTDLITLNEVLKEQLDTQWPL